MLLAFLALISLLPSVSLTEPPRILPRADFRCWEHSNSITGHLDTVSRSDCATALKRIISADKAKAPMVFSRSPDVGYRVPDRFEAGTCIIQIDISPASKSQEVQMPMESVVGAALHIMDNCIKDEPSKTGLGGHVITLSRIDPENSLNVFIFGQPVRPTPRMPFLYSSNPDTSQQ